MIDEWVDPANLRLVVADKDLKPITVVRDWKTVQCDKTQNQPDSGRFTAPMSERLLDLASAPWNRIHLYHNGTLFSAGPIETSEQPEEDGIPGDFTITWTSDLVWLAGRVTLPNPLLATDAQTSSKFPITADGETVLRSLVNNNGGPGGRADRQIPYVVLGEANSPLVGSTVSVSTPISQKLSDVLRDTASASGNLTYDLVLRRNSSTNAPELAFLVWAPVDVSRLVRYSESLSNLKSLTISRNAPTATVAIVGQESDGTTIGRAREVTDDAAIAAGWGRVETWVSTNADSADTTAVQDAQMDQDGRLALLDAAESAKIDATVVDTPKRRYGINYRLGDIVGIQPAVGPALKDYVTGVSLTADSDKPVVVAPTIGAGNSKVGKQNLKRIRDIQRAVARLQAGG